MQAVQIMVVTMRAALSNGAQCRHGSLDQDTVLLPYLNQEFNCTQFRPTIGRIHRERDIVFTGSRFVIVIGFIRIVFDKRC